MRRRDALAAGGLVVSSLSAGCLETLRREDAWRELVVDPPEGVYVPPKIDEMETYGTAHTDSVDVSLLTTRPHSFWTVAGTERARADVRSRHAIHLMATVRDAETGVPVPTTVTTTIEDGSERVDERVLWPMLSQRMGFHYGDNVSLAGDGHYEATVRIEPTTAETAGEFSGRFESATTATIEFDYTEAAIEELERVLLDADEGRGERSALEPMGGGDGHDHTDHVYTAPLGDSTATGDDLLVTASVVDAEDGETDEGQGEQAEQQDRQERHLAIGLRTRYNQFPVPFAGLTVDVRQENSSIRTERGRETIDPALGHYYGVSVAADELERADEFRVAVDSPPQVARHEGYETAFSSGESVSLSVPVPAPSSDSGSASDS